LAQILDQIQNIFQCCHQGDQETLLCPQSVGFTSILSTSMAFVGGSRPVNPVAPLDLSPGDAPVDDEPLLLRLHWLPVAKHPLNQDTRGLPSYRQSL